MATNVCNSRCLADPSSEKFESHSENNMLSSLQCQLEDLKNRMQSATGKSFEVAVYRSLYQAGYQKQQGADFTPSKIDFSVSQGQSDGPSCRASGIDICAFGMPEQLNSFLDGRMHYKPASFKAPCGRHCLTGHVALSYNSFLRKVRETPLWSNRRNKKQEDGNRPVNVASVDWSPKMFASVIDGSDDEAKKIKGYCDKNNILLVAVPWLSDEALKKVAHMVCDHDERTEMLKLKVKSDALVIIELKTESEAQQEEIQDLRKANENLLLELERQKLENKQVETDNLKLLAKTSRERSILEAQENKIEELSAMVVSLMGVPRRDTHGMA